MSIVAQRAAELEGVEKQLSDIAEMAQMVRAMAEEQQPKLDAAETAAGWTAVSAQEAVDELKKVLSGGGSLTAQAEQHQSSFRRAVGSSRRGGWPDASGGLSCLRLGLCWGSRWGRCLWGRRRGLPLGLQRMLLWKGLLGIGDEFGAVGELGCTWTCVWM